MPGLITDPDIAFVFMSDHYQILAGQVAMVNPSGLK